MTPLGDDGLVSFVTPAVLITTARFGSFPSGEVIRTLVGADVDVVVVAAADESVGTVAAVPMVAVVVEVDVMMMGAGALIALCSCKLPSLSANSIGKSRMLDKSVAEVLEMLATPLFDGMVLAGLMIC